MSEPVQTVDAADVQSIVRFGHGRLTEAEYLLCSVTDPDAARAWLRDVPVATAKWDETPPERVVQVAFGPGGLRALGLEEELLAQFAQPFLAGMAGEESRSRRLGDIGPNDPDGWQWGQTAPDALIMLYARKGDLDGLKADLLGDAFARGFAVDRTLPTREEIRTEPFGFADGLSEPDIDWKQGQSTDVHDRLAYSNLLALGEVLLGYRNEYGEYTPRPLADPATDGADALPEAADDPAQRDLGLNGSYLVMRQLHQDVRGFWQFLDREAGGDAAERESLATAMVGRDREGTPLVQERRDIPGGRPRNAFTYDSDPDGLICPVGAHIRRANPRNGDHPPGVRGFIPWLLSVLAFRRRRDKLPGRHDLVASTRFHRLVRRGRPYGPPLSPEEALKPGPEEERGLHFVCLSANLLRQFEFVQNAWMMGAKFDGLSDEADPLLGHRQPLKTGAPTDRFSIPRTAATTRRIEGLPPFVTVRGGAYFFLPGIRALRFIARAGGREAS